MSTTRSVFLLDDHSLTSGTTFATPLSSYDDLRSLLELDASQVEEDSPSRQNDCEDPTECNQDRQLRVLRRMRYLTCVAAIGGFLSGYNTGVISGALLPLTRVFGLSKLQEEAIVFSTIAFAFGASAVGAHVNQAIGRRRTIILAAGIFTFGGFFLFGAQNFAMLVIGEIVLGIGVGLESLTSPLYISEVAKPEIRGMLVSAYGLMMCFGQFFSGIVDGVVGGYESGWRIMFGFAALPGIVMIIGFLGLPESPAWLMAEGEEEKAYTILQSVRDSDRIASDECSDIKESIRSSAGDGPARLSGLLRSPSNRRALTVGCSLMVLQQFCGSNVVMYYSATIYRMSGFAEVTSMWLSAFTGLAQLLGLALSVSMVETAGRRPLVLLSFSGVALCLAGLGASFWISRVISDPVTALASDNECLSRPAMVWDGFTHFCYDCAAIEGCGFCGGACVKGTPKGPFEPEVCPVDSEWQYSACEVPAWVGWLPVVFLVLYLVCFGIGAAGLPWAINSEIYPVKYRSLAVGLSTATNWLCNLLISSTFLSLSDPGVLTIAGSFWLYGVITVVGVLWLYGALPETKGLSYEEIEEVFWYDEIRSTKASAHLDVTLRFMNRKHSSYGSV